VPAVRSVVVLAVRPGVPAVAAVPLTQELTGISGKIGFVFCAIYIAPIDQDCNLGIGDDVPPPPPVTATVTAPPVFVAVTPAPVKFMLVNAVVSVEPSS
jgi:hypothetical protein